MAHAHESKSERPIEVDVLDLAIGDGDFFLVKDTAFDFERVIAERVFIIGIREPRDEEGEQKKHGEQNKAGQGGEADVLGKVRDGDLGDEIRVLDGEEANRNKE